VIKINAVANDTVALIAWEIDERIPNCLGFALTAIDQSTGARYTMQTHVPFAGQPHASEWKGQPSHILPIQKMRWRHYFNGKEGTSFAYELVPMVGTPSALRPLTELLVVSNPITFSTRVDDTFSAACTRGILSTQALAHTLPTDKDGLPDWQVLLQSIQTINHPLRRRLSANVPKFLKAPLAQARRENGEVLMALYELSDPELVAMLLDPENTMYYDLVLGKTSMDPHTKIDDATNANARRALHMADPDAIQDRFIGPWGIAHNKFQVLLDSDGNAVDVTTGSTNWTATGLCCQSNMAVRIYNSEVADHFRDYFYWLKDEGHDQSSLFRQRNSHGHVTNLSDGTSIEVWFSPNMQEQFKAKTNPDVPPDMARVFELMHNAQESIVGELFYPGAPSVLHEAAKIWDARPELHMFITVSSKMVLKGISAKKRKGRTPLFTAASGREVQFANFAKELLKLPEAHAITHGKIVVIDAFGENPVVIFGSHNLGFKASYGNDENLVIVHGNKALAQFVFVNMFDLHEHFTARAVANARHNKPLEGLSVTDKWQDAYLTGYKAKEGRMLATGVWDGSGMEDPPGLKSTWVYNFSRKTDNQQ